MAADGYTLAPTTTMTTTILSSGRRTTFEFRILGPDGAALTRYTESCTSSSFAAT